MRRVVISAALLVGLLCSVQLHAQARSGNGTGTRQVSLPYNVQDSNGNRWVIYQQGMLRQQGNPLYSQGAIASIGGNGFSSSGNQARIDEKTGELLVENLQVNNVQLTRRILINTKDSYVRYVDILRNPQAQDLTVSLQLNSNFNYTVQSTQPIEDPRAKQRAIGSIATLETGRTVWELYATPGSKAVLQVNTQPNNNVMQGIYQLTIPANKQVAILHLHGVSTSADVASQLVNSLKSQQLVSDLPLDIRKQLVNATVSQAIGDREVLRGDLFDVVELRGGDQLKGTLAEQAYKLQTSYGALELPADRVVGLINVGNFRPRQLLVTIDGEVFGGNLEKQTLGLSLSSGQTTQIPLSQITAAGYRKRSGEAEEWKFDRPMVTLRSGERMLVSIPTGGIEVMTRYGMLKLEQAMIARIDFQSEEHGVHQIYLSDGSSFSGLVTAPQFTFQLVGTTTQQQVTFPISLLARMQFTKPADDLPAGDASVLRLLNDDELVGTLSGTMKLDTAFDTIDIKGAELRSLSRVPDAVYDVQATLWDQTKLSGQLRDPQVSCDLKCGLSIKIPVALLTEYQNSSPDPSSSMVERVKAVVADLSADDWKQRERAEAQLVEMGPVIKGVLKQIAGSAPPEAQHRIDSVLREFEKKTAATSAQPAQMGIPE
jgi:hypothetical protein